MSSLSLTPGSNRSSLLALGFRPFFLGAGALALLAMAIWLARLWGMIPADAYLGGTAWHAHEMLFGYVGAVIAGFLLTAARNWTGIETPIGGRLAALALVLALLDLAFFPALALALIPPLWQGKNKTNRVFLALLAAMTLANGLVHAQALGLTADTASRGSRLMLDLTLLTLFLVAGRIMPFFTQSAIPGSQPVNRAWVEGATFTVATAVALVNLALPSSPYAAVPLLALAALQAIRLAGWHDGRAWRNPMLAVVFTFGMVARVTLGHTGRDMRASSATIAAFLAINLAALARVVPPLIWPAHYPLWLVLSGALWMLAFGIFLWVYGPMLIQPRVDGRPG